jgi:hypothetical protein
VQPRPAATDRLVERGEDTPIGVEIVLVQRPDPKTSKPLTFAFSAYRFSKESEEASRASILPPPTDICRRSGLALSWGIASINA